MPTSKNSNHSPNVNIMAKQSNVLLLIGNYLSHTLKRLCFFGCSCAYSCRWSVASSKQNETNIFIISIIIPLVDSPDNDSFNIEGMQLSAIFPPRLHPWRFNLVVVDGFRFCHCLYYLPSEYFPEYYGYRTVSHLAWLPRSFRLTICCCVMTFTIYPSHWIHSRCENWPCMPFGSIIDALARIGGVVGGQRCPCCNRISFLFCDPSAC